MLEYIYHLLSDDGAISVKPEIFSRCLKELEKDDFKILRQIEQLMSEFQWIPAANLMRLLRMSLSDLEFHVSHLLTFSLIERSGLNYEGYRMTYDGYDLLALRSLVFKDVIASIGDVVAVGKESSIYKAVGVDGSECVLKFHREGTSSFKHVKRVRDYLPRKDTGWLIASSLACKKEYNMLKKVYGRVCVPRPIARDRNILVLSLINGVDLYRARLDDPDFFLEEILKQVKILFDEGIIHSELSQYNIMVSFEGDSVYFLDFPQAISINSAEAMTVLKKDLDCILNFFRKKYNIEKDVNVELERIVSDGTPDIRS